MYTHLIRASFGRTESTPQTASRSVQPFLHSSQQSPPYFIMGRPFPPQNFHQNFPLRMGIWIASIIGLRGSLGPPDSTNPNGISIGSAVFAGLSSVTDRPTHRVTDHVCNNRPHLHIGSTAKRHNNGGCRTAIPQPVKNELLPLPIAGVGGTHFSSPTIYRGHDVRGGP